MCLVLIRSQPGVSVYSAIEAEFMRSSSTGYINNWNASAGPDLSRLISAVPAASAPPQLVPATATRLASTPSCPQFAAVHNNASQQSSNAAGNTCSGDNR